MYSFILAPEGLGSDRLLHLRRGGGDFQKSLVYRNGALAKLLQRKIVPTL